MVRSQPLKSQGSSCLREAIHEVFGTTIVILFGRIHNVYEELSKKHTNDNKKTPLCSEIEVGLCLVECQSPAVCLC